ncbi:Nucleoporin p54 [Halotydeus destructor]|nr:Nucleoporin p54 [Halotydeus destructor]
MNWNLGLNQNQNTPRPTTSVFSGFAPATQTTASVNFNTPRPTTSLFTSTLGQTNFQSPSAFGQSGFGQTNPFGQASAGFGQPATQVGQTTSLFGQPTQYGQPTQQQQVPQISSLTDLLLPKIFNDERDQIIGKFNHLQAFWGTGKAIYSADGTNLQLIELNQHQKAHLFKAVAYSNYEREDSGGDRVGILVKMQDEASLRTAILTYESNLKQLFGNAAVKVESSKSLPGNKALLAISVTDPSTNKKVRSHQLLQHLSSPNVKGQLAGALLNNYLQVVPLNSTTKQEIEEYLNNPPSGIDATLWNRAKKDNPDPNKFIPNPLLGFSALNERFKMQEQEVNLQKLRIKSMCEDVNQLERAIASTKAKLEECKKRNVPLKGKVLKAMTYQEVMKKRGFPIQPEEEKMRAKVESILAELNAPTKFKGCLNELMCRVRQMQTHRSVPLFSLEDSVLSELKAHLKQEQLGIAHLLSIIKEDSTTLKSLKSAE